MKAMVIEKLSNLQETSKPLTMMDLPVPDPGEGEVLIRVAACGVCHTELDEIEGRSSPAFFPIVPGHQVVGHVEECGPGGSTLHVGDRIGVAWIYTACRKCRFCEYGAENLCSDFKATGRDVNGGYAAYMTVPADFTYPIPATFTDAQVAPLLCAGAIGYRSIRLTGCQNGQTIGLTGFGASGHLVLMALRHMFPDSEVFVFARNPAQRELALQLGAAWAGHTDDKPPRVINAVIDTTPAWRPVVEALKHLTPGGRLVINAIRKEDRDIAHLENLDYAACLWLEKEIKTVANVTRRDVIDFLSLASEIGVRPEVQEYPLEEANRALSDLTSGTSRGAKVLRIA